jgi:cephalosporin-C deacetylase-like acetyl esterase
MRQDIEFKTEDGITLCGWHYLPDDRRGKVPTIVMAHGFSAVKEMYLDRFAEAFADAGLGSIVFDNRNIGTSDGQPRQEIDPRCARVQCRGSGEYELRNVFGSRAGTTVHVTEGEPLPRAPRAA